MHVAKPEKTLECYRYHWDDFLGMRWILEGCQTIYYQIAISKRSPLVL